MRTCRTENKSTKGLQENYICSILWSPGGTRLKNSFEYSASTEFFYQNYNLNAIIRCIGGSGGHRQHAPLLRVQILLFWHTNFLKHSRFGSWCPPMRSAPPTGNPGSATEMYTISIGSRHESCAIHLSAYLCLRGWIRKISFFISLSGLLMLNEFLEGNPWTLNKISLQAKAGVQIQARECFQNLLMYRVDWNFSHVVIALFGILTACPGGHKKAELQLRIIPVLFFIYASEKASTHVASWVPTMR